MMLPAVVPMGCAPQLSKYRGFEVSHGSSVEERLALAQGFASAERLDWIRQQLASAFPRLRPSELQGVYVKATAIKDLGGDPAKAQVYVIVGMPRHLQDVDTDVALEFALRELRAAPDAMAHVGQVT